MGWYTDLFGVPVEKTGELLAFNAKTGTLTSKANGRVFQAGHFSTPSVQELRSRVDLERAKRELRGRLVVREVVGDVSVMHAEPDNAFALFQAASQFNCLEFTHHTSKPEWGIEIYSGDRTQGPACATSCAAGTVVRNHFALGGTAQTAKRQINTLEDVEALLGNAEQRYFTVTSGYTLAQQEGLKRLTRRLEEDPDLAAEVRGRLRIGVQADTEVTGTYFASEPYTGDQQLVTQAYCSGISVSYSGCGREDWQRFASLVLDGAYEATLLAAVENALAHPGEPGARRVFLTALGGGVFGNDLAWIADAMRRALRLLGGIGLEVVIVSYGGEEPCFQGLLTGPGP